jgi:hypothetical protein
MAKDLETALEGLREYLQKAMAHERDEQEKLWNSFTKEQQLSLFCAVVRRIHKAEIQDNRSYRGTLYGVFEFDQSAYGLALDAGYMDIHNAIYTEEEIQELKRTFTS